MPDGSASTVQPIAAPASTPERPLRPRLVSPLLRRILLVNALPLALLVAALLYLDQYQNGLLESEVGALREQALHAARFGEGRAVKAGRRFAAVRIHRRDVPGRHGNQHQADGRCERTLHAMLGALVQRAVNSCTISQRSPFFCKIKVLLVRLASRSAR